MKDTNVTSANATTSTRRIGAVTLQDVAQEAGVNVMAVSVVLNGARSTTRVSSAARARILEAATRLQYRRNGVARGLSRSRMDTIGFVAVIDSGDINLYFLEVLNGIIAGAVARGQHTTILSVTDWAKDEARILQYCDGRVDGMVLLAPALSSEFAAVLRQYTPCVAIHGGGTARDFPDVEVDDEGGARQIVEHLVSLGHRRILHLAGDLSVPGARSRLAGYRSALEAAGIPFDDSLVIEGVFTIGSGRDRALAYFREKTESLPTAIFCASDAIASGCMEVLTQRGLRVPEDISVAGFDDVLLARMTSPPLTTIRQPFRQMGERAVERLLAQVRGEPDADGGVETLPVELVIRGSTGAVCSGG